MYLQPKTHHCSFHFIEYNTFKYEWCLWIAHIFMLQTPSFLPIMWKAILHCMFLKIAATVLYQGSVRSETTVFSIRKAMACRVSHTRMVLRKRLCKTGIYCSSLCFVRTLYATLKDVVLHCKTLRYIIHIRRCYTMLQDVTAVLRGTLDKLCTSARHLKSFTQLKNPHIFRHLIFG